MQDVGLDYWTRYVIQGLRCILLGLRVQGVGMKFSFSGFRVHESEFGIGVDIIRDPWKQRRSSHYSKLSNRCVQALGVKV